MPTTTMTATTTTVTVQATTQEKRLEGVTLTEGLRRCLADAVSAAAASETDTAASHEAAGGSSASPAAVAVIRARVSRRLPPMTTSQARSLLCEYTVPATADDAAAVPPAILRAAALVLGADRVERALSGNSGPSPRLAFTDPPPPAPASPRQQKWRQRMERLALRQEERRYNQLTGNLGRTVEDDATIRSMTYAASIGINMIVAPLSFGVFMYFFAGGILDYFWKPEDDAARVSRHVPAVDNRRVIAAVVSGVVMLVVEMLLFVIRNHAMDEAMRKKSKTKKVQPFGPYSSASLKTFKGE